MGARHFVAALHTLDPSARPHHMKLQNAICFKKGSPLYPQVSGVTPDTCKAEPLVGLGAEGGTAGRHYHATGISCLSRRAFCVTALIPDFLIVPPQGVLIVVPSFTTWQGWARRVTSLKAASLRAIDLLFALRHCS